MDHLPAGLLYEKAVDDSRWSDRMTISEKNLGQWTTAGLGSRNPSDQVRNWRY